MQRGGAEGCAEGGTGGSHSPLRWDSCSGGCHRTRPCWCRTGPACWGTRLPGWTRQRRPQKSPAKGTGALQHLAGKSCTAPALPALLCSPSRRGVYSQSHWEHWDGGLGTSQGVGQEGNWVHVMPFWGELHTTPVCSVPSSPSPTSAPPSLSPSSPVADQMFMGHWSTLHSISFFLPGIHHD